MRRKHESTVLVRTEKVAAYSAFTGATKQYVALLYSVAGFLEIDDQTEKLTLDQAAPRLDQAFRERDRAFEMIRLIGTDELIVRARAWVQNVTLMRSYLEARSVERAEWAAHVDRANEARTLFYEQARNELGVS